MHGGEPLLIGVNKMRLILQESVNYSLKQSKHLSFSLQTNLTLLDEEYCKLLSEYNVKIGTSLDGYNEYQNSSRITNNGSMTFSKVFNTIIHLQKSRNYKQLCPGIIVTITKKHIGKEQELLDFIRDNNLKCSIRPAFPINDNEKCNCMLPDEYAKFFCNMFDLWFVDSVYRTFDIQEFPQIIDLLLFKRSTKSLCSNSQNCGRNFICANELGDFYSCNRLCNISNFYLGNVYTDEISKIIINNSNFCKNRFDALKECKKCKWLAICNGGCPANAFFASGSYNNKDYFCQAKLIIYNHVEQVLKKHFDTYKFETLFNG